jgi:hypothetical protein
MGEKVLFHILRDWKVPGMGNEVFYAMEWDELQEVFEFTATTCSNIDRLNAYCRLQKILQGFRVLGFKFLTSHDKGRSRLMSMSSGQLLSFQL